MTYPIIAPVDGRRTDTFGKRDLSSGKYPSGASPYHYGIDIGANPRGTRPPVLSPVSGKVSYVQRKTVDARGLYVVVTGKDADFLVQHLSSIPKGIEPGKKVRIGEVIGVMGNSSTLKGVSDHLHFEVHPHKRKGKANSLTDILKARTAADPEKFYASHDQPKAYVRPQAGTKWTTRHKSRHVDLKCYEPDRKTVFKYRPAGFKVTTVLSSWRGWLITEAGKFYPTARLKEIK